MRKSIDVETWSRKAQYKFFNDFEEPFWGVTVEVDCTIAYQKSKALGVSFFFYYLHKSLLAVNKIEAFRYRIEDREVFLYETIGASATVDRPDGTFGFSFIPFIKEFTPFEKTAKAEFEKIRNQKDLVPGSATGDVIHYSSLPWLRFTGLSHARVFKRKDSVPKISFGKMMVENNKRTLPVSIHVHHGLVDGLHVGQYVEAFQTFLNEDIV